MEDINSIYTQGTTIDASCLPSRSSHPLGSNPISQQSQLTADHTDKLNRDSYTPAAGIYCDIPHEHQLPTCSLSTPANHHNAQNIDKHNNLSGLKGSQRRESIRAVTTGSMMVSDERQIPSQRKPLNKQPAGSSSRNSHKQNHASNQAGRDPELSKSHCIDRSLYTDTRTVKNNICDEHSTPLSLAPSVRMHTIQSTHQGSLGESFEMTQSAESEEDNITANAPDDTAVYATIDPDVVGRNSLFRNTESRIQQLQMKTNHTNIAETPYEPEEEYLYDDVQLAESIGTSTNNDVQSCEHPSSGLILIGPKQTSTYQHNVEPEDPSMHAYLGLQESEEHPEIDGTEYLNQGPSAGGTIVSLELPTSDQSGCSKPTHDEYEEISDPTDPYYSSIVDPDQDQNQESVSSKLSDLSGKENASYSNILSEVKRSDEMNQTQAIPIPIGNKIIDQQKCHGGESKAEKSASEIGETGMEKVAGRYGGSDDSQLLQLQDRRPNEDGKQQLYDNGESSVAIEKGFPQLNAKNERPYILPVNNENQGKYQG